MSLIPLERENLTSAQFDDLNGYEKGAVARAFLNGLIKQGYLERMPSDNSPGEITIAIRQWQLELLARFSDDGREMELIDNREILLDKTCQLC